MSSEKTKHLRTGFTTGACATAATTAALRLLSGFKVNNDRVEILFPDGKYRDVLVESSVVNCNKSVCTVVKDAGDDPDITNGAHISVTVVKDFDGAIIESDIIRFAVNSKILIRRGRGVGIVVAKGLDVEIGKAAINPGPQEMIIKNIDLVLKEKQKLPILIEISIEEGELLAPKTLNHILGVENGLSILGTSGLVIPCSNKAYVKTIEMLIRGAIREGEKTIFAVTGGKTHKLIQKHYNNINELAVIRIGDFIKETISYGEQNGCTEIVIGCMPGKLVKYALGYEYTHAAHVRTDMNNASLILAEKGLSKELCEKMRKSKSTRAFIKSCSTEEQKSVFNIWSEKALLNFKVWAPKMNFKIALFGFESQFIGEWLS